MDRLTVKEALKVFYENYQLEADGGIHDANVKVALFKGVFIYFPNFEARRKVLFKHDVHHLLTGYSATMKGETEISAWELSTGCTHNWFAFVINTYGMITGIPFNLKGIWKAWLKGSSSSNLYRKLYDKEQILAKNVPELKKELGLAGENKGKTGTFSAFLTFAGFLFFGIVFTLASAALIPFTLIYSLWITLQKTWRKH